MFVDISISCFLFGYVPISCHINAYIFYLWSRYIRRYVHSSYRFLFLVMSIHTFSICGVDMFVDISAAISFFSSYFRFLLFEKNVI